MTRYILTVLATAAFSAIVLGGEFVVVNKCPTFTVVNKMPAAPVVAAPQPFRSGNYHAGHDCPNCHRSQYVVDSGDVRGLHSHRCTACGTIWVHNPALRR